MAEPRALTWHEQTQIHYETPPVCRCCGKVGEGFATPEDAHRARWDVQAYFTAAPLCDDCPAPLVQRGKPHKCARYEPYKPAQEHDDG